LKKEPDVELPWYGDREWDELGPRPKGLLRFMYKKKQATIDDIWVNVWQEDIENVNANAIGAAQSRANTFLAKMRYPKHLTKQYGKEIICWSS
jgi:hypothetical protein